MQKKQLGTLSILITIGVLITLPASALQICPGVDPDYCDLRFDQCVDDCLGTCVDECLEERETCLFGSTGTYTDVVIESTIPRPAKDLCGYLGVSIAPHPFRAFRTTYRTDIYEAQYCPGGAVFETLIASQYETKLCWRLEIETFCGGVITDMSTRCLIP